MYSPKIKEEYVSQLWHLKQRIKKPITHLANEAIAEFLNKHNSQSIKEVSDEQQTSIR